MKSILLAAALSFASFNVLADSCMVESDKKKLAGAAKTSFMKKCETDAQSKCEASAADKKLAGAAKTSHVKKCVEDAVGPAADAKK